MHESSPLLLEVMDMSRANATATAGIGGIDDMYMWYTKHSERQW
jgi:hypothetical protein